MWEQVSGTAPKIESIAFGDGSFLGVSQDGSVYQSLAGGVWTEHGSVSAIANSWVQLRYHGDRFYIAGTWDGLWHSSDGASWTEVYEALEITDILPADDTLVAVGNMNQLLYGSPDLSLWADDSIPRTALALAKGLGRIVGVGYDGAVVRAAKIEPHIATSSRSVSPGQATFTVSVVGTPPCNFSWYQNEKWLADTTEPELELTNLKEEDGGEYKVLAKGEAGATWSRSFHLTVPAPPRIIAQPQTVFANPGETAALALNIEAGRWFRWEKDGAVFGNTAAPILEIGDVTAADVGEYTLTASNVGGSITSEPIALRVILDYDDWSDWKMVEGVDPEQLAPEADPTGSGIPNLLRYVLNLGTGPDARARLPRMEVRPDPENQSRKILRFIFQRRKAAPDVDVRIEHSENLDFWTEVDLSRADISVEDAGGVEIVTLRIPLENGAGTPTGFFRLAVQREE